MVNILPMLDKTYIEFPIYVSISTPDAISQLNDWIPWLISAIH